MSRPPNCVGLILAGVVLSLRFGIGAGDVVTVVSSKSAVTNLSKNQVADIFLGKSNRFPDGEQAIPIDQPEASSAREQFYNKVTGKSLAQLKAHWSKIIFTGRGQPPKMVMNSVEVKKQLADNPSAIGYIDDTQVDTTVRVLSTP
jgi:ABC-type phosphate transport system substrate-binding protein